MPFLTLGLSHRSSPFPKSVIHTYDAVLGLLADMGTPGVLLNAAAIADGWSGNASAQEWKC